MTRHLWRRFPIGESTVKKRVEEINDEIAKFISKHGAKEAAKLFEDLKKLRAGKNFRSVTERLHKIARKS